MSLTKEQTGAIYLGLLEELEACPLPEPWTAFSRGTLFRGPVKSPGALIASLLEDFTEAEILESGVGGASTRGELIVNDCLTDGRVKLAALRREDGLPLEILTCHGTLRGADLPIFTAAERGDTVQPEGSDERHLVVAFTVDDVAVLRACGIPATLACGLSSLRGVDCERFCTLLGVDFDPAASAGERETFSWVDPNAARVEAERAAATAAQPVESPNPAGSVPVAEVESATPGQDSSGFSLLLVGWSPAALNARRPVGYQAVISCLQDVDGLVEGVIDNAYIWNVQQADIDHFGSALRRCPLEAVRGLLVNHALDSPVDFQLADRTAKTAKEKSFADVQGEMAKVVAEDVIGHFPAGEGPRKWRELEESLQHDVIRPLMNEALECPDFVERNLRIICAQLSRMTHIRAVVGAEYLSQILARDGIRGLDALPRGQLGENLGLVDRVISLSKEISRLAANRAATEL